MRPFRSRWARGIALWTLGMSIVAIALAVVAAASLVDAQQACFIGYPAVPCPGGGDWRVGLLTFAFFGVPLIWVVGVVVAVVGRALVRRRRERGLPSTRDRP